MGLDRSVEGIILPHESASVRQQQRVFGRGYCEGLVLASWQFMGTGHHTEVLFAQEVDEAVRYADGHSRTGATNLGAAAQHEIRRWPVDKFPASVWSGMRRNPLVTSLGKWRPRGRGPLWKAKWCIDGNKHRGV